MASVFGDGMVVNSKGVSYSVEKFIYCGKHLNEDEERKAP